MIVSTKCIMMMAMMMVMSITANAMSYTQAKNEALFLSDKMAYELNLTDAQYDAVYEINLDYMMSVNGRNDVNGKWWNRRNTDLQYVLTVYQYNKYVGLSYFYRPLTWNNGNWTFNVYSHYTNHSKYYKNRPTGYVSYKGGNNKKSDRYYANKNVNKQTSSPIAKHDNGKTNNGKLNSKDNNYGNTSVNTERNHENQNHQVAQNTKKSSHFGSRR